MYRYGPLLLAMAFGGACLFAIWRLWRRSAEGESTKLMDYVLLWPLLFRAERQSKTPTRRWFVLAGILVFFALIVADGFIDVPRHG